MRMQSTYRKLPHDHLRKRNKQGEGKRKKEGEKIPLTGEGDRGIKGEGTDGIENLTQATQTASNSHARGKKKKSSKKGF